MTENKPITNIIFDNLNQRIKNIDEKCLNFQEQNKNLKEQLSRKTQECERHKLENKKLKQSLRFEEGCKNMILKQNKQLHRYEQAIKNISKCKIGNCCCAEEYAMKILQKCEDVNE